MIDYQDILGEKQATAFVESLQTVVEHLEVRQQQLIAALQQTAATLSAFKQLQGGDANQPLDAIALATIAHLEDDSLPQLQAVAEEISDATIHPETNEQPEVETIQEPSQKARRNRKLTSSKQSTRDESESKESSSSDSSFNPRHALLREFEGKTVRDAITTILQRQPGEPMNTEDVTRALYGRRISQENLKAAKRLVVVELSKGKLANRWANVEGKRGYYVFPSEG
ncbi:hypothetical protein ACQ4M4_24375 [Leptolyngbya sp. AN02str]|uniref:hypothetical protein n=1 Tax=Leptolyngbya sp. AN02str TaxID=3423363 RepID=UPI003D31E212